MNKLYPWIVGHKKRSLFILIVVCVVAYWGYSKLTATESVPHYVIGSATKDTLIVSLSGSGQVLAGNQVDIAPRATGEVTWVGIKNGQEVRKGTLLATIDSRDAQKSVRDAEVNLESAKLSLQKLVQPADNLSLIQSENALLRARENKVTATAALTKDYDDGFNAVANAFLELPTIIGGLQDTLFSFNSGLSANEQSIDFYASAAERYDEKARIYRADTYDKYQAARKAYDATFAHYKTLSRTATPAEIEAIITESYETTKIMADAIKSANNLIQFYKDKLIEHSLTPRVTADTHLATLSGYTAKTNTHLGTLLNAGTTITNDKDTILNAERTIVEQTASLEKLRAGADALDISSSNLTIKQRENALRDAREKLADYSVYAPFAGTIAKVNVDAGDTAGSGTSIATLITKQKIAQISLNEIDAAKVSVGQKATLTFDAIEDLSIAGSVAEVDAVGTVAQGVVTYAVKISFDTQDERVKSGMTVNAAIITSVKQDALSVPLSAVKTRGDTSYVLIIDGVTAVSDSAGITSATLPREQVVEIGLTNDTSTEIVSGITEGAFVVTRTISPTTAPATAPSLFGGGGGARFPRN